MSPKTILQSDKRLCSWWSAIAHSEDFQRILLYVSADLLSAQLSPEAQAGARTVIEALTNIADAGESIPRFPGTGLNHDLESDLRPMPLELASPVPKPVAPPKKKGK